jgi:hypothetical protein
LKCIFHDIEPSIRKQGIIKHITAISHLSFNNQLYFGSSNLDFCGSNKPLWLWEIKWKVIQAILLVLEQVKEFFYNYFPKCGCNSICTVHVSNINFIFVLQVRKITWFYKEKNKIAGQDVNHCFTSSLVTLKKLITFSDIGRLILKWEYDGYLSTI